MKKYIAIVAGVLLGLTLSVRAEFAVPSDEQLAAAANDPAQMNALLQGASAEQAAQVVKTVIVHVLGLGLDTQLANSKISAVVRAGFSAMPAGTGPVMASSLGSLCGFSTVISVNPAVVSVVQNAVASSGGGNGAAMATAFGKSFVAAKQQADANANGTQTAPPLAIGYGGQK